MDTDVERKIDRALSLAEDNQRILKKLLAYRRWETAYAVLRWVIFIVVAFGLYYYLQPYLEQVMEVYGMLGDAFGSLSFPDAGR